MLEREHHPAAHSGERYERFERLGVGGMGVVYRARAESAAEVIAQLELIGELPTEVLADTQRLAHSFLLRPRFIGRTSELAQLHGTLQRSLHGSGAAVRVVSGPGSGRSRVLDELGLRAKLDGALVLRVDAGMARQLNGVARARAALV